jgi:hypothetical protein
MITLGIEFDKIQWISFTIVYFNVESQKRQLGHHVTHKKYK